MGQNVEHVNLACAKSKQIHIIYYNACSLLPKLDELQVVCEATRPDVICIVETWLDISVIDNEIVLSGYQLFRLDRNRHGGGVAVYVHDSLLCKVVLQGGPFYLELISISFHSKPSFCLTLFYRPPSSPVSIFDNLCTTLQIINPAQFYNFILLGNFNVNFCNTDHFLLSHMQDILLNFSLSQVVSSYTYISSSGNPSLIDLAMMTNPEELQQCTTILPLSNSDHYGVSLTLEWNRVSGTSCKSSMPRKIWLLLSLGRL